MLYRYSAISRSGSKLTGEMEAVSRAIVLEDLHKLGHLPVEVIESNGTAASAGGGGRDPFPASRARARSRSSRASLPCS